MYGIDLSTFVGSEPDLSFRQISGKRAIAEAVARRWLTPRGDLVTDENAGIDIRQILNAKIDDAALYMIGEAMQAEAEKDERVAQCVVNLSFDLATNTLTINGFIDPVTDESVFEMVFSLTADTVSKLVVR